MNANILAGMNPARRFVHTDYSAIVGLAAATLLCLGGCAVGPDFVRPTPPQLERYTPQPVGAATISADGQAQHFESGAQITADWWHLFNSRDVDDLVSEALADNANLEAAQATLRESQQNLRAGYGVFYPQLNLDAGASREKFSAAETGEGPGTRIFNLYTLNTSVSFVLDVFGGNRRSVEALSAQVDYERYNALGTYLTLSGNVVNTAIACAAYAAQISSTEELVALLRDQVEVTRAQVVGGIAPYANLLSAQSQLASVQATLPPLRLRLDQSEHLLIVLTGHAPAERAAPTIDLEQLALPSDLPVSLPSQLVRQRPDILAAEAQLHSASANIGVATAAMFPQFTLNGSFGQLNNVGGLLLRGVSSVWALGADLATPLFRGGTLWYQRKAAEEAYQAALANYRQSVLSAFEQVADALRAVEHDAETVQAEEEALQAARGALQLLQANYQAGTANYLQVLIADAQYHQASIGYIQARAQRLQDTAALFVALGGGWWNRNEDMAAQRQTTRGPLDAALSDEPTSASLGSPRPAAP